METVLITGASSGIGRAMADLFAADGAHLVLVARSEDKLNELAEELHNRHGTQTTVIVQDLAEVDAARRLYDDIAQRGLQIDTLINNAGFGQFGRFFDIPLDRQLNMIQLNIATLTALTHLFLQEMKTRNAGAILNVGSTASFQPGPNCAVYYATKAFVLSFTEALYQELRRTKIKITCLCPGPTETGFGDDSGMKETRAFRLNSMDVKDVAKAGYRGLRRGRRLIIPGLINKLLATSVRFTPRSVILDVISFLQPMRNKSDNEESQAK